MKQHLGALVLAAGLLSPVFAGDGDKKPCANVGGVEDAGGTVTGLVKFTGKQPERKPLSVMTGNAYCNEHCKGEPPMDEKWVFGKNGDADTFGNVLVYVSKGLEGRKFAPPKEPAVLDQVGCVYTPRVVGVMVGQTLQVRNSDATLHNVMANLRTNKSFNEGMSVKGATIEKVFQNCEFKADFRCFMHPWMVAYVHVMEHPYYAVTGPDGAFTLRGLPPGEYEIATLHESTRFECSGRVTVTVASGETKKIEFTYKDAQ
ncbi:MAG TPA: carboxypeptidase regulatory-like domain-containing protein [Planctomycetota bacterium]|nr:carboxypeptidase regulatory-like domain-containing protein [Planctomycetota bacterium]